MYTQLYTQLLSFENQRITKYMNQPKDDAAIILGSIISARDVLTIGRMPASFTLLQCDCSLATTPCQPGNAVGSLPAPGVRQSKV